MWLSLDLLLEANPVRRRGWWRLNEGTETFLPGREELRSQGGLGRRAHKQPLG